MSLELAPTSREDSFRQRFYLYLMMTKPSHRLILSYAGFTQAGKAQRPGVQNLGVLFFADFLVPQKVDQTVKHLNHQFIDLLVLFGQAVLGIRGFKQWDRVWEATYRGGKSLDLDQLNALRQEMFSAWKRLMISYP